MTPCHCGELTEFSQSPRLISDLYRQRPKCDQQTFTEDGAAMEFAKILAMLCASAALITLNGCKKKEAKSECADSSSPVSSEKDCSDASAAVQSSSQPAPAEDPPIAIVSPSPTPTAAPGGTNELPEIGASPSYSAYFASFDLHGEHDTSVRTISLGHGGVDEENCSRDGGTTWTDCDSDATVVFSKAEYEASASITVQLKKAGYKDTTFVLTPATDAPGKTIYACDQHVTDSETFDAFEARVALAHAGEVICLDKAVTIFNTDVTAQDYIDVAGDDLMIIGTAEPGTTFVSMRSNGNPLHESAFIVADGSGVTLAHLDIQVTGNNGFGIQYLDHDDAGAPSERLYDISISVASGTALSIGGVRNFAIEYSGIVTSGYTGKALAAGGAGYDNDIDVTYSFLGGMVYANGGSVNLTLTDSSTSYLGLALTDGAFSITGASNTLSLATVETGTKAYAMYASSAGAITINDSTFKHPGGGANGGMDIRPFNLASPINMSGSGNIVCNETSTDDNFDTTTLWADLTSTGTFSTVPAAGGEFCD